MSTLKSFLKDESGATAIEYGLIAAVMGTALLAVMPTLGSSIKTKFAALASSISKGGL